MKKSIILSAALLTGMFINAQTVILNAESGNIKEELSNCWQTRGEISYVTKAITGTYGIATGLTTGDATDLQIKSPWLKLKAGSITLKAKLTAEGNRNKSIIVSYIPFVKESEGTAVTISTYAWPNTGTTVQNISVAVPASIANDGNPYKILFSFGGDKEDGGILADDISIPATYFSDPSNDCLPLSMSESASKDEDGDGVANGDDGYPADAVRAFDNQYPANGNFGTLMYEDLWPSKGDYDFNDLVMGYKFNMITNSKGEVIEIKYTFKVRAIGASFRNGFAFQLDNIQAEDIVSVTGGDFKGDWAKINSNGTELNQKYANILVFEDAYRVMPSPGGSGVNVSSDASYATPVEITVTVSFVNSKGEGNKLYTTKELNANNFNPYLIVNQDRGTEIHLADYIPTDLANFKLFGTSQDNTNPDKGIYYKSKNNLPWGLNIVDEVPYSRDTEDFLRAYPAFGEWVESNGEKTTDWYDDKDGYRNLKSIYIIK